MKMRIALSLVAAGMLAVGAAAYADPAPPPDDNGIGTSPSYDLCFAPPAPCGIWVDGSPEFADERARAGEPPDVIVFTAGHTSCADAIAAAEALWPSAAAVFELEQVWRAKLANPPAVAPAMFEWRAPAPPTLRAPLKAGVPWGVLVELLSPLITLAIGKLFHTAVKDTSRQAEILSYANTAFQVVEQLGRAGAYPLGSNEKYSKFIEQVFDALKAAGRPEPTAAEMEQLKKLARDKSILAKPVPARPPLPLQPPPRG